jgi:hypothetical protein
LNSNFNYRFDITDLKSIIENNSNVERVDFWKLKKFSNESIIYIIENCERLKYFRLRFCEPIYQI